MATKPRRRPAPADDAERHATTLRLPPALVRVAAVAAASRRMSLNAWLIEAARAHALHAAQRDASVRAALEA
jgi:predicted HicB family RNase H-like nuclease